MNCKIKSGKLSLIGMILMKNDIPFIFIKNRKKMIVYKMETAIGNNPSV